MKIIPERLRNYFRKRSAWKNVPPEIYKDKNIQKAVKEKALKPKKWKRRVAVVLSSVSLSMLLPYAPDLYSDDYNDYMGQQGHAKNLKDHFHAANIRVYHRGSLLAPFHQAGAMTKLNREMMKDETETSAVGLGIMSSFFYAKTLVEGLFTTVLPFSSLNAYSYTLELKKPVQESSCYIHPPGDFTLQDFLSDFSGLEMETVRTKNKPEDLQKTFNAYVMLHEARHCDQNKNLQASPVNESDADLYSFKVLKAQGTSPALLQESQSLIRYIRIINAVAKGDISHASGITLNRGEQTLHDAHNDAAIFQSLHNLLVDAHNINKDAFEKKTKMGVRLYYLTEALLQQGLLKSEPELQKAAESYMTAIWYFDQISGNKLLDKKFDGSKIDLSLFGKEYKPVADKLAPPEKAAAPGV